MAQAGFTPIQLYHTTTASTIPLAANLLPGELGINVVDKRIFTRNGVGAVVELGTAPSTISIIAGSINNTPIGATTASTGAFTNITASGTITAVGAVTALSFTGDGSGLTNLPGAGTAGQVTVTDDLATNATVYPMWVAGTSGNQAVKVSTTRVTLNPSTGVLSASAFAPSGSNVPVNGFYAPGANILALSTASTMRLRINANGNIGVGVTPDAWGAGVSVVQFSAVASFYSLPTYTAFSYNVYTDGSNSRYQSNNSTGIFGILADRMQYITAPAGTTGGIVSNSITWQVLASNQMLLGTTNAGMAAANRAIFALGSSTDSVIELQSNTTGRGYLQATSGAMTVGSMAAIPLVFTINSSEKMRVHSDGNVGIGGIPTQKISLFGAAGTNVYSLATNGTQTYLAGISSSSTVLAGTLSADPLLLVTGGTEKMRIDAAGNVGVGITPSAWSTSVRTLQIGTAAFTGAPTGLGSEWWVNGYFDGASVKAIVAGGSSRITLAENVIYFNRADAVAANAALTLKESMRITSVGEVGIGTNLPDAKLGIGAGAIRVHFDRSNYASIFGSIQHNGDAFQGLEISNINSSAQRAIVFSNGTSYATRSERMRIDSEGNAALGQSYTSTWASALKCLEIGGALELGSDNLYANVSNNLYYPGGSSWFRKNAGPGSMLEQVNGALTFLNAPTGPAYSGVTMTPRFTVTADGNVGIGTTSTGRVLSVVNPVGNLALYMETATGTAVLHAGSAASYLGGGSTSTEAMIASYAQALVFGTSSTEKMRIETGGAIGIGGPVFSNAAKGAVSMTSANSYPLQLRATPAGANYWQVGPSNVGTFVVINQASNGVVLTDGATGWASSLSDERAKTALEPIADGLAKVASLRALTGRLITDEATGYTRRRAFLIAQDVQAVLPEAVQVVDEVTGYLTYTPTDVIPLLVAAIKELNTKLATAEGTITRLSTALDVDLDTLVDNRLRALLESGFFKLLKQH